MEKASQNRKVDLNDLIYKDNEGNITLGVTYSGGMVNPYTKLTDVTAATGSGLSISDVSTTLSKNVDSLIINVPAGGDLKVLTMDNRETFWYFQNTESVQVKAIIADDGNTANDVYVGY